MTSDLRMRIWHFVWAAMVTLGGACGDDVQPSADVADSDGAEGATGDSESDTLADAESDVADSESDTAPETSSVRELLVVPPIPAAAPDPLVDTGLTSCAIYQEEACTNGTFTRCEIWDGATKAFTDTPEPLTRRAFLYDRWYDLYHQPDGVTAERAFVGETPAGTPEAEWAALAHFSGFAGVGDGAIWTGAALDAAIFRYAATGTRADYARMEKKVRDLLRLFDVTGIPGYLARHMALAVPAGAPKTDQHITEVDSGGDRGPFVHVFDPAAVDGLDPVYRDGLVDGGGTVWKGTPIWDGNPSIDQYTGPMVAFPIAFALIEDEALRARMTRQLTCYLNRLRRVDLVHLQSNELAREAVRAFLAGGQLQLEPGDPDFATLDTVVAYVSEQPNSANVDTFDTSCPDRPATTPSRVIDAASDDFLADLLEFVSDIQASAAPRARGIDHVYAINVRGGDAAHLAHLAAMAWYMTGDPVYRDFLWNDLVDTWHIDETVKTIGALEVPKWCRSYYGDHITIGPLWALIGLLDESPLKAAFQEAFETEAWQKSAHDLNNVKFALMYASAVPATADNEVTAAREAALLELANFGGNGGVLEDPRREYTLERQYVIDHLPAGTTLECPSPEQRTQCETGISFMGVTLPGEKISRNCHGTPGECHLDDGLCAEPKASLGLPAALRTYEDFVWQRNPFDIGARWDVQGRVQSAGLDLSEEYWLARERGFLAAGSKQVLAWREVGSCGP